MARILREPTVGFAVLAALLFVASALFGAGGRDVIEIDRGRIEARILEVESNRGTRLSADERKRVEEAYVNEQVLAREARARGLHDDPRIDELLVRKMLHVLSGDVVQPTREELEAYYEANRSRYAGEPAITVDEIVAPVDDGSPRLRNRLRSGVDPARLESEFPISRNVLTRVDRPHLERIVGSATAGRIWEAGEGEWIGPHQTVRGEHWFRVRSRIEPSAPPLDRILEQVRFDWIDEEETARLEERIEELRNRYTVTLHGEERR